MFPFKVRILFFSLFITIIVFLAISPFLKQRSQLSKLLDWSQVVDDPKEHLNFNVLSNHNPNWKGKE